MKKIPNILKNAILTFLIITLVSPAMCSIGYADSTGQKVAVGSAVAENIEEEMEFLYIESTELEAPGTQNIVISWDENIKKADQLELVYTDKNGNKYIAKEKNRTVNSVLFAEHFAADKTGEYTIIGVNYTVGENTGFFAFNDVEIKATFTVVDSLSDEPVSENIASVEQSGNKVDSAEIESQITDALEASDVSTTLTIDSGENIIVVLDPGHGSQEAGASSNGLKEYELNYKIAQYCKKELESYEGVEVYLTHDGKGFSGTAAQRLQKRVDIAATKNADVLVSLHINSTGTGAAHGAEIWYPNDNYKPEVQPVGKGLAREIQEELVALGLYDRGIKEKSTVDDKYPDGSLQDWYGIIRMSKLAGIPAIIVEHAFIDNKNDVDKFLSSDSKLQKLGLADASGIAEYFNLTKKRIEDSEQPEEPTSVGWKAASDGMRYYYEDGNYATGYVKIEGSYYYFNTEGIMQKYDYIINGVPYYFASDGKAVAAGWVTTKSGVKKYSQGNGKLATGYLKIGNYYYGFNSSGTMQKGTVTMGDKRYVFTSDGKSTLYTAKTKVKLNYRTGPSTSYKKKGTLKKGATVSIIRTQNGWGQMTNGYWVKLSYVTKKTTYPQKIKTSSSNITSTTYKVKLTANLNYRTGPSTKYAKKGTYKKGKTVTIKKVQSGWGQMTNGYWVKLSYTKKVN